MVRNLGIVISKQSVTTLFGKSGDNVTQPVHFYSPHTIFLRKSGQSHEVATALCSLLLGLGYDAYVVCGYATKDTTQRIMIRVDSPYPAKEEMEESPDEGQDNKKYAVKPPRDLRSKFLLMMEQREIDKVKAAKQKMVEMEKLREEEEEKPPPEDLEGGHYHFWVLLRTEGRAIDNITFIEPSTGTAHPIDSPNYIGIESVWNHLNYWVNMQDLCKGPGDVDYNLHDGEKWEHLLVAEPISWRQAKANINMEDDEIALANIMEEKHLDMPIPWSLKISISHQVLKQKFPEGVNKTWYKRTLVEEYAPYVQIDGLVTKITRFKDFDCTDCTKVEDLYQNRQDKMIKVIYDTESKSITEYFASGREDAVIEHKYSAKNSRVSKRIIKFNAHARHDGLLKIEVDEKNLEEQYVDREDLFYYRQVNYAKRGHPPPGFVEGHRKIILHIVEKFLRNPEIPASENIAVREFEFVDREIRLKYHFGEGKVTATSRNFIKPAVVETGEGTMFTPDLTYGYEAEVGVKPPSQLQLYLLFQKMLREEEKSLARIREIEDQIAEFLALRDHEMAFPKLEVSLFNIEQNEEYRLGMLEKEKEEQERKEKEIEEAEIDYLKPYFNQLKNPEKISEEDALKIKDQCLADFKQLLFDRAIDIQKQFEKWSLYLKKKQEWYSINQDIINEEDEIKYFQDVNDLTFLLLCYEIRLGRHRDLSSVRYEAMVRYINSKLGLTDH